MAIKATIKMKIPNFFFTQSRKRYGCPADSTISGEKGKTLGRYRALIGHSRNLLIEIEFAKNLAGDSL